MLPKAPKDPNRYQKRHAWYLRDAQVLVQRLQAAVWPLGFHVALGGGVLNHGYSDNDLDIYVLPIYGHDADAQKESQAKLPVLLTVLADTMGEFDHDYNGSGADDAPGHSCFSDSLRYSPAGYEGNVDVFVVRP